MKKTLLEEYEEFLWKKREKLENLNTISTINTLLVILKNELNICESDTLRILEKNQDNSIEVTNTILENLNLKKNNISVLKFIFHERINNIYFHEVISKIF